VGKRLCSRKDSGRELSANLRRVRGLRCGLTRITLQGTRRNGFPTKVSTERTRGGICSRCAGNLPASSRKSHGDKMFGLRCTSRTQSCSRSKDLGVRCTRETGGFLFGLGRG
jgi:hypothetical protein